MIPSNGGCPAVVPAAWARILRPTSRKRFFTAVLATLRRDVPLKQGLHDLEWAGARPRLTQLCAQLGDNDLPGRVPRWQA